MGNLSDNDLFESPFKDNAYGYDIKILSVKRGDRLYDARRMIRVSEEELSTMKKIIDKNV